MAPFVIEPHFRLQEWVAEEKGYFREEGLDYVFRELVQSTDGAIHDKGDRVGAYQSLEAGRAADELRVSLDGRCGRLGRPRQALSRRLPVAPAGIFVPSASEVTTPDQLAGVPISVGYQSAATTRPSRRWNPTWRPTGSPCRSTTACSSVAWSPDRGVPAAALFSGPYYFAEQLGFRKIIDTTFMIATMVHGQPDPEDLGRFFRALRCAQRDIDVRPDLYTHYYRNEFPVRFHPRMDTRRWDPVSASCSSPTQRRSSTRPSGGSPSTASSPTVAWALASTSRRSSRCRRRTSAP